MNRTLSIVGAGRLGTTLGYLLHRAADIEIVDVVNRSLASAQAAVAFIGCGRACDGFTALAPASMFLLAVPDDQIAACCETLARSGALTPASVVFHCSGALPASALHSAAVEGAAVASIHPVRSFADPSLVAQSFSGTLCGVEGASAALSVLEPMFQAIGARFIPVPSESKALYHAAAVFASNYLVSILGVAQQAYIAAGIAPAVALEFAMPLAQEAIANVARLGPAAALTGPIARGDELTVARQHAAVAAWNDDAAMLYATLADATRRLAASRSAPA